MLPAEPGRFLQGFWESAQPYRIFNDPDGIQLPDCRLDHLVQIGGLTVHLPVHLVAHILQDPDVFKLQIGMGCPDQG